MQSAEISTATPTDRPEVVGNPANVEFYRRAGWQVIRHLDEPLPIWVMRQ
ncbi:hypothetical protein [Micromonospora sp. DT229]